MKKPLLLIFTSFLISSAGIAQSSLTAKDYSNGQVAINNNDILSYTTTAAFEAVSTEVDFTNTDANTNYYKLRRIDEVINGDAEANFCVGGGNCYPTGVMVSPITVTLTPGGNLYNQNLMYLLDYTEGSNVGYSRVRYEIYNINNANDVFKLTLVYNDNSVTGVKEISSFESLFSAAYPNPVVTKANFIFNNSANKSNLSVSILNSLGSTVLSENAELIQGKNVISIDTENLSSGIYFVSFTDGKNKTLKKITINK